jgi:hypothetical protein
MSAVIGFRVSAWVVGAWMLAAKLTTTCLGEIDYLLITIASTHQKLAGARNGTSAATYQVECAAEVETVDGSTRKRSSARIA